MTRGAALVLAGLAVLGLLVAGGAWWHHRQESEHARCVAFSQAFGGRC